MFLLFASAIAFKPHDPLIGRVASDLLEDGSLMIVNVDPELSVTVEVPSRLQYVGQAAALVARRPERARLLCRPLAASFPNQSIPIV